MADDNIQTKKTTWYEDVGNAIVSGVNTWDGLADSMLDTVAPGKSQMDGLISDFSNSNMLTNLLTSNAPVLNVKMALEELCNIILKWDEFWGDGWENLGFWETVWKALLKLLDALGKALQKLFMALTEQLIKFIYNAVLKLRRMVVDKLKQFLAEYVADACLGDLAEHLNAFANPQNALNIKEMVSSFLDMLTDVGKSISVLLEEIRMFFINAWNFFSGSEYLKAKTEHETRKAEFQAKKFAMEVVYKTELVVAKTPEQVFAANKKHATALKALELELKMAEDAMVTAGRKTLISGTFWLEMVNDFICARTSSFVQNADFGLKAGIQNQIKEFMQGCLFQQIMKTSDKIDPGSLTSDVLNRIGNLAQQGNMMDAYNVGLAAGVDIAGEWQVQIPSMNGYVTKIYGDPYAFSPETPLNASQIAKYLTDDLPTTEEILTGNISEDKLDKTYISDNWDSTDSAASGATNKLNNYTSMNRAIISGTELVGSSIPVTKYSIVTNEAGQQTIQSTTENVPLTKSVDRQDLKEQYLS